MDKEGAVHPYNGSGNSACIQQREEMKFGHLLQCGWNLRILCQVKQASHKKTNITRSHLYEISSLGKFIKADSRLEVARGWWAGAGGEWGYCFLGTEFLSAMM